MCLGSQSHAVGANFVCSITVGSDAVRTHYYCVNAFLLHGPGSHIVRNERHGNLILKKLVGRESSSLQERPRFIGIDHFDFALCMCTADNT